MAAITTLVAPSGECYEVKACMQCNNCVINGYLSTSEASFSQWGFIQIQLPLPFLPLVDCVHQRQQAA